MPIQGFGGGQSPFQPLQKTSPSPKMTAAPLVTKPSKTDPAVAKKSFEASRSTSSSKGPKIGDVAVIGQQLKQRFQSLEPSLIKAKLQVSMQLKSVAKEMGGMPLKAVSQHAVLNLGALREGSTTLESSRSRKLGADVGAVPLDRDRLPDSDGSLDIVGHSSDGGMKIEGKSPRQLALMLKEKYNLKAIGTINLVSCKSEAFKTAFQEALLDLEITVGNVQGATGKVAVDRASGQMLDEEIVGPLHTIKGHDGDLGTLEDLNVAQISAECWNLDQSIILRLAQDINARLDDGAFIMGVKQNPNQAIAKAAGLIIDHLESGASAVEDMDVAEPSSPGLSEADAAKFVSRVLKSGVEGVNGTAMVKKVTQKMTELILEKAEASRGSLDEIPDEELSFLVKDLKNSISDLTGKMLHASGDIHTLGQNLVVLLSDPGRMFAEPGLQILRSGKSPEIAVQGQQVRRSYAWLANNQGSQPGLASLGGLHIEHTGLLSHDRPSFSSSLSELACLKTNPSQAKRHITAWHSIRNAANILLKKDEKGYLIDLSDKAIGKLMTDLRDMRPDFRAQDMALAKDIYKLILPGDVAYKHATMRELNDKDEVDQFLQIRQEITGFLDKTTSEAADKKVAVLMFMMNSNPNNLWPGDSHQNSNINTIFGTIKGYLDKDRINTTGKLQDALSLALDNDPSDLYQETLRTLISRLDSIDSDTPLDTAGKKEIITQLRDFEVDLYHDKQLNIGSKDLQTARKGSLDAFAKLGQVLFDELQFNPAPDSGTILAVFERFAMDRG